MTNAVSDYFNKNWNSYTQSVNAGVLFHKEMYGTFGDILQKRFPMQEISLADFGCGDLSSTSLLLSAPQFKIKKLIGVDGASEVLEQASESTRPLNCEKEFICSDMLTAARNMPTESLNVIFSSYALHHYKTDQKEEFLKECKRILLPRGIVVLVDGVLGDKQTRTEWIDVLMKSILENAVGQDRSVYEKSYEHVRSSDFPDSFESFRDIARKQKWQDFQIALDKGHCACLIFVK